MGFALSLSDHHARIQEAAHSAFDRIHGKYRTLRANERQHAAAEDVWLALAELGYQGFLVPVQHGGSEEGLLSAALVMEELAAQGLHSFQPILQSMGAVAIARFGSDALKEQVLGDVAAGRRKLAIASTEAEAGFNVLNIKTFAERQGDLYLVNGRKHYVSGADVADSLILVARTRSREECEQRGLPRSTGMSLFLVDSNADGLERTRIPSRGEGVLSQYSLTLHNVQVPASHRIGDCEAEAKPMFAMFNPERTLVSAMAIGMSRYCLNLACERARTRRVFGDTPIGAYQSVQHPLAAVSIRLEAVRLQTLQAAWLFDQGADIGAQAESANAAKYLSAELVARAVDTAIDTFGGKGFDEEYGVIHLWEAARLLKTAPISNALILNQVAERTLGLPRSY
jgi:alkylation response protein AidB-like acyl-CoA dehydrogenase